MNNNELLLKELDLIQSCILRMANNSFQLKGWAITLATLAFAVMPGEKAKFAALIPVFAFWYLDAFYLRLERLYIKMYNWVLNERPGGNTTYLFNLNPERFADDVNSIANLMMSTTLRRFYGSLIVAIFIAVLLFTCGG